MLISLLVLILLAILFPGFMRVVFGLIGLGILYILVQMPSAGAETWDESIRRLCTSTQQEACWVKSGAPVCDRDQVVCRSVPDHAPAKILGKDGKRWQVQTAYGSGWVNERLMMIDGSK
ncbi:hypothetical protein GGR16_002416 [Chelatococcus caeni]|uniref:Uncharacterized protein n=1 Tax=Chelatococcus caeni TaxID=1348468 RepID=A0A840C4R1_9HYPH|nr:hypothetical protein [Chelatococcus caeni]MBB4017387.1 hypothetical protein [Chelatococcus caeni]